MTVVRHAVAVEPRTTRGQRQAWEVRCRCSWSSGSYISDTSARAAGERHLAAVGR